MKIISPIRAWTIAAAALLTAGAVTGCTARSSQHWAQTAQPMQPTMRIATPAAARAATTDQPPRAATDSDGVAVTR